LLGAKELSLVELRKQIDKEFFILSEAHYQHHIAPLFLSGTNNLYVEQVEHDQ
jgi:hypothetical protein